MTTTQNQRRSSFSSSTAASNNRRSSFSSSTASSLAKRSSENMGKAASTTAVQAKKRAPLANLTNQKIGPRIAGKGSSSSSSSSAVVTLVPCATKISKVKNGSSSSTHTTGLSVNGLLPSSSAISNVVLPCTDSLLPRRGDSVSTTSALPVPCSLDASPSRSDACSFSMDESMSTCDSFKSPEVEYMDNEDVSAVDTLERKTFSSLCISENLEPAGTICNRDAIMDMDTDDDIVNLDDNMMDPQLCATFACDIYKHLRASEAKKRPSIDFMERLQKDINSSMRAILVDWLVEVSEEYRLVPDTLYLTVNYIDRYLSGNAMNRQRLQLLGVACMMIAAKYEEICAPQVEEFCYITDNTYFKEEVLQMESDVLNYLKFEMTAPTAKCFLRRFVRAAQGINEVPSMHLECMANYIAELSLLEYSMLPYAPSLIAASSIFLANYILSPTTRRPWNSTLEHYTLYQPSDLHECVKALHQLCCNSQSSNLPAIREKYSQHKYKFVAKKYCPALIPPEFFHNSSN